MTIDLFGYAVPPFAPQDAFARRTDPEPSHEGANAVDAKALQGIVLAALKQYSDGATTEQLAKWTGLSLVTVSPRMKPLEAKGLVVRAGKRLNKSGVNATVWRVV